MKCKKVNQLGLYKDFLSTTHTMAFCDRDFVEWHNGIKEYGFWAIEIDDSSWLQVFEDAREHLSLFLFPGYRRAPHITIAPFGLIDPNHFSKTDLQSQLATVTKAKILPFSLRAGALDSFSSAPYISIVDPTGSLPIIRGLLQQMVQEDNIGKYVPHVTLGHFRNQFETTAVANHLQRFTKFPTDPLRVQELLFCSYKTKESQGPFKVLERVKLGDQIRHPNIDDGEST